MRLPLAAALLTALAVLAPDAPAAVHPTRVGTFATPVYAASPPGDRHRLFVVEKEGRIMVVRDGVALAKPFLDSRGDVTATGEQGLLSMAFARDYVTSRRVFVYYTA